MMLMIIANTYTSTFLSPGGLLTQSSQSCTGPPLTPRHSLVWRLPGWLISSTLPFIPPTQGSRSAWSWPPCRPGSPWTSASSCAAWCPVGPPGTTSPWCCFVRRRSWAGSQRERGSLPRSRSQCWRPEMTMVPIFLAARSWTCSPKGWDCTRTARPPGSSEPLVREGTADGG